MPVDISFSDVIDIIDKLVVPLIGWVAWEIRNVNMQLRVMNGRLGKVEQWAEDHDEHDRTRFDAVNRYLGMHH
jgi:hypothetical protein